ncbi:MAG TPA: hypothetical protein VN426_05220 [Syntrophomonadaceae bacterium]|nr:hypothetical protein [Syntrophomonadaceae bacterium]
MKKTILIPVFLLVLLIITWLLRWDFRYSQEPAGQQIVYLNDRWLSQSWTDTYAASDDNLINGERKPLVDEAELQKRARLIFSSPEGRKKEQVYQGTIQQARSEMDKYAAQAFQYSALADEEEEAATGVCTNPVVEIPADLKQAYIAYGKASADLTSAQAELDSLYQIWAIPVAQHQLEDEKVADSTNMTRLWLISVGIICLWLIKQWWLPYYNSLEQKTDGSPAQTDEESLASSDPENSQE